MSAKAAANPATTPARLTQLAAKYPAEVLHNPVLPLLLLTQPDWLEALPAPALTALLHVPGPPAAVLTGLLAAAAAHPDAVVRAVLAGHPQLPPNLLARLATDSSRLVGNAARYRADAPPPAFPALALRDTVELGIPPLAELKVPYYNDVLLALLALPGVVRPDRLGWLLLARADPETGEYPPPPPDKHTPANPAKWAYRATEPAMYLAALAGRPDVPLPERLRLLAAADPPAQAARWFAHAPQEIARLAAPYLPRLGWLPAPATPAELTELAAQPFWLSQLVAAGHPHTPPEVRRRLLDESSHRLLWQAVAANPGWTPDELRQLLEDDRRRTRGYALRLGLLHNPHTPPDVLLALLPQLLASGSPWEVRQALAAHPQLPPTLAAELVAAAQAHTTTLMDRDAVLLALARNPATPPALLAELAAYPSADAALQPALAQNPATPSATLRKLAAGRSPEATRLALCHPAYPAPAAPATDEPARRHRAVHDPAALPALAADQASAVRRLVAENPATPPETLARLAADKIIAVRAAVAANPATPPETLTQLAHDDDSLVRREVAGHPAAPAALLAALAADANKYVRRRALGNPRLPAEALPALAKDKSEKNRLLLLHHPAGRRALLLHLAGRDPVALTQLHLLLPEVLADEHRAALAASPVPGHRLAVAHLPELATQLRDDPHLLVRLVARGELGPPDPAPSG